MNSYRKLAALMLFTLSLQGGVHADTSTSQSLPENSREYTRLIPPVASALRGGKFLSFYCGPCSQFVENYPVIAASNKTMHRRGAVTQYHASAMEPLGHALTEAWAIAMGKTKAIEQPLFEAMRNGTVTSVTDIQTGIDIANYDNSRQSMVEKGAIARQDAAIASFGVKGTPSFYINNADIATPTAGDYVNAFAQFFQVLLNK
ncbi:protein disulfide oxidoreductase DsbA [Serratia bockelmannii]|uniref:protein disulfide oxidoreductase DsbA n=1 Tax=Serratia bockelmannii TaxID=2703793 RepID=UPI00235EC111|nr:protein disulfide oxidoreductase DsbA [Serratia bockelmannii]